MKRYIGYCVKCRVKRKISEPKPIKSPTHNVMIQGTCGACGTKMSLILGKHAGRNINRPSFKDYVNQLNKKCGGN